MLGRSDRVFINVDNVEAARRYRQVVTDYARTHLDEAVRASVAHLRAQERRVNELTAEFDARDTVVVHRHRTDGYDDTTTDVERWPRATAEVGKIVLTLRGMDELTFGRYDRDRVLEALLVAPARTDMGVGERTHVVFVRENDPRVVAMWHAVIDKLVDPRHAREMMERYPHGVPRDTLLSPGEPLGLPETEASVTLRTMLARGSVTLRGITSAVQSFHDHGTYWSPARSIERRAADGWWALVSDPSLASGPARPVNDALRDVCTAVQTYCFTALQRRQAAEPELQPFYRRADYRDNLRATAEGRVFAALTHPYEPERVPLSGMPELYPRHGAPPATMSELLARLDHTFGRASHERRVQPSANFMAQLLGMCDDDDDTVVV